ncbi:MAG: hypothetical protein Q9217_004353 [Psora testacea]
MTPVKKDTKEHYTQQKYDIVNHRDDEAARRQREYEAAKTLQRTYRGHRERRHLKGLSLDPASRWTEAIREAQYRSLTTPRSRAATGTQNGISRTTEPHGPQHTTSAAHSHWALAGSIARRANTDEQSSLSDSSSSSHHDALSTTQKAAHKQRRLAERQERVKSAKTMDLSYFLEMVDVKHRYGSNLRKYHAEWNSRPTRENFFYWLDHGDGRNLDLPNCTRKRLDEMRVRYLNKEERMLYEVVVDKEGRLVWKKDGVRVDTTDQWRDSVDGIVKVNDPAPLWADRPAFLRGSSESSGTASEMHSPAPASATIKDNIPEENPIEQPAQPDATEKPKRPTSLHDIFGRPAAGRKLEKAKDEKKKKKKKQQWIFVADTKNNLYIGIKQSGAFQHSSFLHGSRISAAGLIQVRDGQLQTFEDYADETTQVLQPRSGHYRTPSHNLHIFIKSLQSRGVDMSMTAVSGSYAAMVGIEGYMKTKGRWKELKDGVKGMVDRKGRKVGEATGLVKHVDVGRV